MFTGDFKPTPVLASYIASDNSFYRWSLEFLLMVTLFAAICRRRSLSTKLAESNEAITGTKGFPFCLSPWPRWL